MGGGYVGRIFSGFRDYATGAVHLEPAIDGGTRGIVTTNPTGIALGLGEVFSAAEFFSLESGISRNYVITTPADGNIGFIAEIETSGIAELFFFEDTDADPDGTLADFADLNRQTKNTTGVVVRINPTINDDGTQLPFETQLGFSGKGSDEFGGNAGGGLILDNSSVYLLRLTSTSSGNICNVNITLTESAPRV